MNADQAVALGTAPARAAETSRIPARVAKYAERRAFWPILPCASLLLVACWAVVAFVPAFSQIGDVSFYAGWGRDVWSGSMPYRDFQLEYPPGALFSFLLPEGARQLSPVRLSYVTWFRVEVLAFWLPMLFATAWTLRRLGADRAQLWLSLVVTATFPFLLGSVSAARYDIWPALLTALAVAALVGERPRLACVLIGAGIVAKLYPAVLLPIALVVLWRRDRVRGVLEGAGVALLVSLAGFGWFLVRAPEGLWHGIWRQLSRPLQIESSAASLWALAHVVGGLHVQSVNSYGSDNLVTHGTRLAASLSGVLVVAALVAVWARFARGPAGSEEIVVAAAAAIAGYLAFNKVFSPQYLIWLLPLVVLVRNRLGQLVTGIFVAAVVLTQMWEPFLYWQLLRDQTLVSLLLFARDVLVVALFVLLLRGQRSATAAT